MKIELMPPQEGELMLIADRALATANELVIDSQEMADAAAEELRAIARRKDDLDKQRKSITGPLDVAKKNIMDLFRRPVERLEQAEGVLKRSLLGWTTEQRRLREAEEARRRAEAEAEQRRLAEIAAAQRAEAERLAAAAAQDPTLFPAVEAAQAAAETTEVMAQMVVPAAPAPVAKVEGVSTRKTLQYEVTDMLAYVRHVAATPHLLATLAIAPTEMRAAVRLAGVDAKIPGVRVYEEESVATRRR